MTEMLKKTPFCDILKDFSENEPSGVEMWYSSYVRTERAHPGIATRLR